MFYTRIKESFFELVSAIKKKRAVCFFFNRSRTRFFNFYANIFHPAWLIRFCDKNVIITTLKYFLFDLMTYYNLRALLLKLLSENPEMP